MRRLYLKNLFMLMAISLATTTTFSQSLFFSEYIEGSSNNRALEIYNPTDSAVDLSNYVIMQSRNAAGWAIRDGVFNVAYVLSLSGTLDTNEVYIIYNVDAVADISSVGDLGLSYGDEAGSRNAAFTGNDAMGLFEVTNGGNDTVLIDIIGTEVLASASNWSVAGTANATQDHTLVRKSSVTTGNATEWAVDGGQGSAGLNTDDSEWIVYDQNTYSFLGYHGLNNANNILSFVLAEQTGVATIDATNHTVDIEVAYGTDVTALTPTITVSYAATISPDSGTAQNFTNPVTYTVTAENGNTQDWTVTVSVKAPNTETDILSFSFSEQTGEAVIDTTNHTVDIEVLAGTDVTSLVPTITVSNGATINPASGVAQNFTDSFTYTITAEDGVTTQDWTVTVSVALLSDEAKILNFEVHLVANDTIMTGPAIIDTVNYTIDIEVEIGTVITALIPEIEISAGATIDPASGVVQDYTSPLVYTVTAQDGTTQTSWTVTVTIFAYPILSIHDIQYTEDSSGDSPYTGQTVTTSGIITAVISSTGFYLQDGTGLWNGIYVYTPGNNLGVVGDSVMFTGEVSEYFGLTELGWVDDFQIISSNNDLPELTVLTASQMSEGIEGVLLELNNFTCVNVDFDGHSNSLYVNSNEPTDTLMVHDVLYSFEPVLNYEYSFKGIGNFDWNNFKIEPRDSNDVSILTIVNNSPVIENVYVDPEFPTTGDDEVYVLADITDDVEVISKSFYYGTSLNDISNEIVLEPVGFAGIQFRALLPVFNQATMVYYKFNASDVEYSVEFTDSVFINDMPQISNVTVAPEQPIFDAATITAKITDVSGVENAVLYYGLYSYDWGMDTMQYQGDDLYSGTIIIPQVIKAIDTMYFKIVAKDMTGVENEFDSTFLAEIVSVEMQKVNALKMYPNPANNYIKINSDEPVKDVIISTIEGKRVLYIETITDNSQINISSLKKGIYLIKAKTNTGKTVLNKFIKQ